MYNRRTTDLLAPWKVKKVQKRPVSAMHFERKGKRCKAQMRKTRLKEENVAPCLQNKLTPITSLITIPLVSSPHISRTLAQTVFHLGGSIFHHRIGFRIAIEHDISL